MRRRWTEAEFNVACRIIKDRAKTTAMQAGDLPSSRNELAGWLAGFAFGVLKDITPEMVRGYIAGGHASPGGGR